MLLKLLNWSPTKLQCKVNLDISAAEIQQMIVYTVLYPKKKTTFSTIDSVCSLSCPTALQVPS